MLHQSSSAVTLLEDWRLCCGMGFAVDKREQCAQSSLEWAHHAWLGLRPQSLCLCRQSYIPWRLVNMHLLHDKLAHTSDLVRQTTISSAAYRIGVWTWELTAIHGRMTTFALCWLFQTPKSIAKVTHRNFSIILRTWRKSRRGKHLSRAKNLVVRPDWCFTSAGNFTCKWAENQ